MSTANNTQVGGQHYKAKTIQPWDYIAANGLGYFEAERLNSLLSAQVCEVRREVARMGLTVEEDAKR